MTNTNSVFIDHYQNLDVEFQATDDQIKQAFRKLAKLRHPDKPTGSELSFLNLYCSYETLISQELRKSYDKSYLEYYSIAKGNNLPKTYQKLPPSRIHYPTKMSVLAQHGLLKKKIRSRHIKHFLNLNYDMELFLSKKECLKSLIIQIPITKRAWCKTCLGSNPHCGSCHGIGSYKTFEVIEVPFFEGISPGFIYTLYLKHQRPTGAMEHFKKERLLIKAILQDGL